MRCSICRARAIETAEAARPLFNAVKQWVGNEGLVYNNLPLSLELCGKARLSQLLRDHHLTHARGATVSATYSSNGREFYSEVRGVAVLRGLPAQLFQGITIHELGHVWLVVHGLQGRLPLWAEEGFCELLAYRFYQLHPSQETAYYARGIEENHDPIYGDGFRRVRAIAERSGFAHLLTTLRVEKRLPA
jgi:hypothetical protein